ncbi:glutamate N-acetyltransferase/amino-acid N-acetyltransferase [Naumannella cuiyingiana]|uniref:Arginine biosynthesis bifunctional protein ArgJ n=1 Tax=Naumannella cuiyingiana TaxID=1347891 RepID=A0A7Z0DBN0_9ACTN|nr:bifunctional glutamate N-acetyltransferase/amino-acid acetyltransferase ArgJ [Naumannella cuiyingiana]NYI72402.1 glutamate N-acetyltransferase/amino-acid N-acetyltransferase [Naumannella cuiyingiana]
MSVTDPVGFTAAGATAGLKPSGRPDLAVVHNTGPEDSAAAVFTGNRFPAAPVTVSRAHAADGHLRAVVLNSGGANACTGEQGLDDARAMAAATGAALGLPADAVAVCSTGLIGQLIDLRLVGPGIASAARALAADGGPAAAEAIMTTDTVPKQARAGRDGWSIGGMAKGAGMLAPGLATMLVVLTTDASVPPDALAAALQTACRVTFDRADSDGCMSTNDTVIALANGASGIVPDPGVFATALTEVCADLARQLIADAEGASHEIAITVVNAASEDEAVTAARAVARSNLFKCAVFGNDPNWGRVLSALGTTDVAFSPEDVDVSFNKITVCRGGAIGEDRALVDLSGRSVEVGVDLRAGSSTATVLTNDLTYDYVKENAEYST